MRNICIARVLIEFGRVRELNEGVKRIYLDRAEFCLEDLEYTESCDTAIRLSLKNNIEGRKLRRAVENVGSEAWENLADLEKDILACMGSRQQMTRADRSDFTNRSVETVNARLNILINKGPVRRQDSKDDYKQTYV